MTVPHPPSRRVRLTPDPPSLPTEVTLVQEEITVELRQVDAREPAGGGPLGEAAELAVSVSEERLESGR